MRTICRVRPTSRPGPGRKSASASTSRTCSESSAPCSMPTICRPTAAISTGCSRMAKPSASANSTSRFCTPRAIRRRICAYKIGDAVFVGDTLFMPDYGTARADFPGGDAHQLYRSIQRLLRLPDDTRLFMCHDYKAPGRDDYAWETTVRAAARKQRPSPRWRHRGSVRGDAAGARRDLVRAHAAAAVDPGEHPCRAVSPRQRVTAYTT